MFKVKIFLGLTGCDSRLLSPQHPKTLMPSVGRQGRRPSTNNQQHTTNNIQPTNNKQQATSNNIQQEKHRHTTYNLQPTNNQQATRNNLPPRTYHQQQTNKQQATRNNQQGTKLGITSVQESYNTPLEHTPGNSPTQLIMKGFPLQPVGKG